MVAFKVLDSFLLKGVPEISRIAHAQFRVEREPQEVAQIDAQVGTGTAQSLIPDHFVADTQFLDRSVGVAGHIAEWSEGEIPDVSGRTQERPVDSSERNGIVDGEPGMRTVVPAQLIL